MKNCDCGHWEIESVLSREKVAAAWVAFLAICFMMTCVGWTIISWMGEPRIMGFKGTLALSIGLATYITFMAGAMQMLQEEREVFVRNKP